jgi:hypothetical protein
MRWRAKYIAMNIIQMDTKNRESENNNSIRVEVDVIIPVHNAAKTIVDTVRSAMNQVGYDKSSDDEENRIHDDYDIEIHVCCYDGKY